jgi:hypothetical protein
MLNYVEILMFSCQREFPGYMTEMHYLFTEMHYLFTEMHYLFTEMHYLFTEMHYLFTEMHYLSGTRALKSLGANKSFFVQ